MLIYDGNTYREMTPEEIKDLENIGEFIPSYTYKERVIARIRERYSVDDELAILRQRDSKPEEFAQYNNYVEQIKTEEREIEQYD